MADLVDRDREAFWHPCGQQRDYIAFPPLEIVGARGSWLHLSDGDRVLDAISSWWCKSLGHGHPRLSAALKAQADAFEHVIAANTTSSGVVRLCERLIAMANGEPPAAWGATAPPGRRPGRFVRVFLADNGSTAVEVALKMALQAQAQGGRARRTRFAALANGYHGETAGALSVGDCGIYKDTFAPMLFPCAMLGPLPYRAGPHDARWDDAAQEWPAIERALAPLADTLAAIVYEPVLQGAGGMRLYSPDLLRRLRRWADAHDVLLIADEIAAGMGRLGAMLAGSLAGVDADLVVLSKGLTGGYLPLSAVVVTDAVYAAFDGEWSSGRAFLHSNTWCANALAVAVANAALDVYADEDVLGNVARVGPRLRLGLDDLARSRPHLREVRGCGMMAAADLRRADGSAPPREARTGWRAFREAVARGVLLRPLGDTLYLVPPLNASADEVERMIVVLGESADAAMAAIAT
ncbi:MAG TPA: adenosylmethionine--8-amino-7-oxononanoate transaminase [Planctomycetota bacterium]|nr:adenosylmethionine--8-amino-7-oxononanoate transaminase [Planctomycetota bacterium]